jgi:F-type H+-transporting ATPase subunit delta
VSSETTGAIAQRYAAALFELAEEHNALDQVAADLKAFRDMAAASDDLIRLLRSPVIGRDAQVRAITAVADKAGFSDLTRRFLGMVAGNRRLFSVDGMIGAFLAHLAAKRGEVTATVSAAAPLSDAQLSSLTETLKAAVGSKVAIDVHVDPSLLGGLVVRVGSRMIDNSLRTKLQHLQLAMKGVG